MSRRATIRHPESGHEREPGWHALAELQRLSQLGAEVLRADRIRFCLGPGVAALIAGSVADRGFQGCRKERPRPGGFDDDVWELYDTNKDWTQANNLAKQMPEKLHELQRLWLIEATRYNVLPLDDDIAKKMNPDTAGRPTLIKGKTQLLFSGMGRLSESCVLNIKNKSHSVTAQIVVPEGGAEGVIVAQGANIGGWSLYAKGGKLKYCYNLGGVQHFYVESANAIPAGEHQVRMEFAYAGGGLGKGGKVTLYTDGKRVGEGTVAMTLAMIFSADDGCDVGEDSGSPVSEDYGPVGNRFNGLIKGVQLAIADAAESADHLVKPEDAIRIAMARQ
jgi:arylsulfatase